MSKVTLEHVANNLVNYFKKKGYVVHFYSSFTSSSHYIKLDYGLAHTIRISDHHGKKHLLYRYNLLKNIKKKQVKRIKKGVVREYYPISDCETLIKNIERDKNRMLIQYGPESYRSSMLQRKKESEKHSNRFWNKAVKI